MKNFVFAISLLMLFSCTSNDIIIEEISFIYDNNNAQPSLVSNNGNLSLTWISSDEDMNSNLNCNDDRTIGIQTIIRLIKKN